MPTVTTWRYYVTSENGEGGAIIFLDSIGCFSALSDYGNYGYRWDEAGWGPQDFRTFVAERGDDSLLEKLTRGALVYDGEATARAIKNRILSERRQQLITARQATVEWKLLTEEHGVESSEADFWNWLSETRLDDIYGFMKAQSPPQAVSFIKRVIPRLREAIRVELEAEAKQEAIDDRVDAWHAAGGIRDGREVSLADWLGMSTEEFSRFLTDPKGYAKTSEARIARTGEAGVQNGLTTGHGGTLDGRMELPETRADTFPTPSVSTTPAGAPEEPATSSESWGVWCLEDRAWCHDTVGSRKYAEAALPRWQSGEAADVDPARFHYEVRPVVGREAETAPGARAVEKFSKAEQGGTGTAAGGTAHDLSKEKSAECGSPSAAKSDPGDSSASPARTALTPYRKRRAAEGHCMSNSEGDCDWAECPQLRDDEPRRSGRHCPRDKEQESC